MWFKFLMAESEERKEWIKVWLKNRIRKIGEGFKVIAPSRMKQSSEGREIFVIKKNKEEKIVAEFELVRKARRNNRLEDNFIQKKMLLRGM